MPHIPAVSVVIPLYQSQRTIAETLASVTAQTLTDFEVVVIDDGSSDRGPAIVRESTDPRVRLVSQANRGLAGARNTGIREAVGTYVALVDADDCWHPTKLARHVELLQRDPKIGVSFSASRFIDDESKPLGLIQRPQRRTFTAGHIFCRNPVGNGSAPVIRRTTLDEIAFFEPTLDRTCWFDESFRQSEDIECWTRIAACTPWQFGYIDEPLTDYRVNSNGLSANTAKQLESWHRFRAKVKTYAPALEHDYGNTAEAYQLRYLARRAIKGGDDRAALGMMVRALKLSPRMLFQEPTRTLVTLVAAAAQKSLPKGWYGRFEAIALERMIKR
jgi:glycosyltransferase involved in cell wall biosynthesis